jgi:hypothetical protein
MSQQDPSSTARTILSGAAQPCQYPGPMGAYRGGRLPRHCTSPLGAVSRSLLHPLASAGRGGAEFRWREPGRAVGAAPSPIASSAVRAPPAPVLATLARRPVLPATVLAGLLVFGFVLLRLVFATSLGGFVVASDRFVDPSRTPDRLEVVAETGGYDGQFVYRLAVDPWTVQRTEHGVRLDNPGYRQQRIATPVLAWALALLPGLSTMLALVLVNAAALVVAAGYGSRLAVESGRHPLCGLLLAFPACMPISLGRDLTEPVAWAAVLAGLWYARRRRWAVAALTLTVAVLSRETSLIVVAGLAVGAVVQAARAGARRPGVPATAGVGGRTAAPAGPGPGPWPEPTAASGTGSAGWLALPIVVGISWQVLLWLVWGTPPLRSGGSGNLADLPLLGVFGSLVADLPDFTSSAISNPLVGVVVFGERLAVLALFCYAGLALLRGRGRLGPGEAVAWALSVAMAMSLRGWSTDVQFLRAANEAVGLSLLVAVGDERVSGRLARSLGAGLVVSVALMYVARQ